MRTFNSYSLNNFQMDNTNIINYNYHPVHYTSPYDVFVPLNPFTIFWTSGDHQSVLLCEHLKKFFFGRLLLVLRVLHVKAEENGNPLPYSCLENPLDRGAWWAAVCGVAQSQTRLKWLSSSSSYLIYHLFHFWYGFCRLSFLLIMKNISAPLSV